MTATIKVQMDNAAFEDSPSRELARILRRLADQVEAGTKEVNLRDVNGNAVGTFKVRGSR